MSIATIAPEFFTNIISSFVVDSDVGLGGILGSLMFNVLGVAAFAGMATKDFIQFDWWVSQINYFCSSPKYNRSDCFNFFKLILFGSFYSR